MYLWLIFFILLILVRTWAAGRDCDLSDGYIRDHRGNVTDNCDQECGFMQCGDVCINAYADDRCYCGEEKLRLFRGSYYCCVDWMTPFFILGDRGISPDNRTQCIIDSDGDGHCPWGRVVRKSDTCNGHCFNDYKTSAAIGYQPYYRCGNHQCVSLARIMCRGYPQCLGSRDVSVCDKDLKCSLSPGLNTRTGKENSKGYLVSDLSNGHYYCDYDIFHNDGKYDTITRKDETNLNILSRRVQINYINITECNTAGQFNLPGLICGDQCVKHSGWCRETMVESCGKFSTNNKQLCANTTFWAGKSCEDFYASGRKAAVGRRCTGAIQHCIYPWYTSDIYYYEVLFS